MKQLEGKVAVVTGSNSGIGQAIVGEFARAGALVAITFHSDKSGAEETYRRVRSTGGKAIIQQLDVTQEASVAALFDVATRRLGPPHILVNDAGIGGGNARVADMTLADFDRVLKTDLYGPFLCCREFIHHRMGSGVHGGKIINMTSVLMAIPSPRTSAYGAAKGGLLTFTRSLALELAPMRINVNAIAPGLIRTPMTAARTENSETMKRELPHIPWNRAGEPQEVARLALYLASDDSDYVTGQSFTIDGGLELNWGQGA